MTIETPPAEYNYAAGAEATKLDQLLARYDAAKDAADAARKQLEEITAAIKSELTTGITMAGQPYSAYHLTSPELAKPLHLRWTVSERLDTRALRGAYPQIADQFTKASGTWVLARDRK